MSAKITDISFKKGNPGAARIHPLSIEKNDVVTALIKDLHDKVTALDDNVVDYNVSSGEFVFRGHKQVTSNGGSFHALRKAAEKPMAFSELKLPPALAKTLLCESLCKGGLILVSGMTGTGKSTTLASSLSERLKLYGGMAVTIENPIEILLEGEHGEGYCIQSSVSSEEETHEALRGSLRCFPSKQKQGILMLGEIRDGFTASHALNSALSGHIVLTTIHGNDIITALRRIVAMASRTMSESEAQVLLAETLRIAIHQRYENGMHKFNMLANKDNSSAIAQHISTGSMEKLSTNIQQQANQSLSGEKLW